MKRLLLGAGMGAALAYGWRRLFGAESEPEPQPTWTGTDNDPEDLGSVDDDLLARTRDTVSEEKQQADATAKPSQTPPS